MSYIDEKVVLEFYLNEIKEGRVNFLRGHHKERVKGRVEKLLQCETIHTKIETAKNLWKALFEASMSYIDPNKKGYDKIFDCFEEFVSFEELIFASDSFYRDHTLHSLWVYFLWEYIERQQGFKNFVSTEKEENKKLLDDLYQCKDEGLFDGLMNICEQFVKFDKKEAAIRCVAALCHDLGYPLKKIEKINKGIKSVLPYFSISNINEFKFKYSEIEQAYIDKFVYFLSCDVSGFFHDSTPEVHRIANKILKSHNGNLCGLHVGEIKNLTNEERQVFKNNFNIVFKVDRNSDKYLSYSRNFEEYKHGIMSAFLLMKNLKAFESMNLKESNEKIQIQEVKFAELKSKQNILLAIANHTSDNFVITELNSDIGLLTFIDELEEFSRISRANKNREYVEQFCHTRLFTEDGWFNVEFIFDNETLNDLDPERAFKGRCERFLKLFDIPNLSDNLKVRLKCIGKLQSNENEYMLEIARKYAKITINNEEQFIPRYLKSAEYYSREEYEEM